MKMMAWRGILMSMLMLAASFLAADRGLAAEQTAEAYLKALYAPYRGDSAKAPGIPLDSKAKLRRYFEPSLAALIIKDDDEAKKRDEIPALEGDPFVDAQDWKIAAFDIGVAHDGDDKATGTVGFKNSGKPMTIKLELVRIDGAWKISDIIWPEGTLRGLYKTQ